MSNHVKSPDLWLIGTGPMAVDYYNVLSAQQVSFEVIGRGPQSAARFAQATGMTPKVGGVTRGLVNEMSVPASAIVAVSVDQLAPVTAKLISFGVRRILVEKPAGLNVGELNDLERQARSTGTAVFVAYNRRFYASTQKAREIIASDGGVKSFTFEFTEFSQVVEQLSISPDIKSHWLLANSTHVIDLAFFLGGQVRQIHCHSSGGLSWHPSGSIFVGSGVTEHGVPFAYHANWEAPGRWQLQFLTANYRLLFAPLEKLQVVTRERLEPVEEAIDDRLDTKFKPGLFRQVEAFLKMDRQHLCALTYHAAMARNVYAKISSGAS